MFSLCWALQIMHPVLGHGGTQEGEQAGEAQSESVGLSPRASIDTPCARRGQGEGGGWWVGSEL